jgi:DNA-binding response OmpR family regulator
MPGRSTIADTDEILQVLIVDDDDSVRKVLTDIVAAAGHKVHPSSDGSEAVELIRRQPFDLVITDLMMPGADGMEVLRAARRNQPEALVIIITGHASLQTAIEAVREGAYDYIRKPSKLEEIELASKNAGERIRLLRENKRLLSQLQEAYRQLELIKGIMEMEPSQSEGRGELPRGLDLYRQRNAPFIPDNRLPLSSLQVRRQSLSTVLTQLDRLDGFLEKRLLTQSEFLLLKTRLLSKLNSE